MLQSIMDGHGRETFHFTRVCGVFSVNSISFHSAAPLTNMKHLMMHHVMKYYLRITLQHFFIWCPFSLLVIWRYLSTILLVAHDWWRHWFGCTLYMIVMTFWQQRLVPKNIMYHSSKHQQAKSSPKSADGTIWYMPQRHRRGRTNLNIQQMYLQDI